MEKDTLYGFVLLAAMVICIFGIPSLNLSDTDKANLAAKPMIYQRFIQFCRIGVVLMFVGFLLYMCTNSPGSSRDCDYDSRGEHCY